LPVAAVDAFLLLTTCRSSRWHRSRLSAAQSKWLVGTSIRQHDGPGGLDPRAWMVWAEKE
jgi:hypothetical protein